MCFNFVNIQAYEIKLTRKFKYTENLAGAHVTQVDVDACYEWRPSKLQPIHNRQVCYRFVTDLLCLLYICYRAVTDQQSFHRSVVYLSLYCR